MLKIITVFTLLSLAIALQAASMILHPKVHHCSPEGGLISASVQGMSPNLTIILYNLISGAEKKLIGTSRADSKGFVQFPNILILNKDTETWYGEMGHYVTLMAEDDTGKVVVAGLRIN